jgi:hypothetical protein
LNSKYRLGKIFSLPICGSPDAKAISTESELWILAWLLTISDRIFNPVSSGLQLVTLYVLPPTQDQLHCVIEYSAPAANDFRIMDKRIGASVLLRHEASSLAAVEPFAVPSTILSNRRPFGRFC